MEKNNDTKWLLKDTIEAGKKSIQVMDSHGAELQDRLQADEWEQHKANVTELEFGQPGQKQTLADQMSKTKKQNDSILQLHQLVIAIRKIVMSRHPTKEVQTAYGVGQRITLSVASATAAGNILLDAYSNYKEWSKGAGILEGDITQVELLLKILLDDEKTQDDSVYTRTAKTMDKNSLQRAVEDEVTRLSAMGMLHFIKNPAVAKLFADLIP
jgi:hypothetical protein